MRFLADMGISPTTVSFLRSLGYEAIHLLDLKLERLPDGEILALARAQGYVLLTHDLDFGELVAASGEKLPSVLTFRLRNMKPDRVNRYLQDILARHGGALEQGAILSISEGQVRLRALPIPTAPG